MSASGRCRTASVRWIRVTDGHVLTGLGPMSTQKRRAWSRGRPPLAIRLVLSHRRICRGRDRNAGIRSWPWTLARSESMFVCRPIRCRILVTAFLKLTGVETPLPVSAGMVERAAKLNGLTDVVVGAVGACGLVIVRDDRGIALSARSASARIFPAWRRSCGQPGRM
jgi:hypothetical protein